MARVPHRFAPFLSGVIQVAITTALVGAVGVLHSEAFGAAALVHRVAQWLAAWLLMLPIVNVMAPLPHRQVAAIRHEAPRRCP